eukprot:528634_1
MSGDVEVNDKHDKYKYEIETWPGCSGSPIFASNIDPLYGLVQNDENTEIRYMFKEIRTSQHPSQISNDNRLFLEEAYSDDEEEDTKYDDDVNDGKPRYNLYGIHIYGDPETQRNIGVKIDKNKMKWIDNHIDGVNRIIQRETLYTDREAQPKQIDKSIKKALKAWEFVSFWNCDHCGYTNQRLMIGGLWKLYNQSIFCGLCFEFQKPSLLLPWNSSNQRVIWNWSHVTGGDDDDSCDMKHDIDPNEMPKPSISALIKQTSSFQANYVPTESMRMMRFGTRYGMRTREFDQIEEKHIDEIEELDASQSPPTPQLHNNEYSVYGTGFSIQYHELEPVHSTLKEQVLDHNVSEDAWDKELKRAKEMVMEEDARACMTGKRYGIQIDEQIHIENTISIAIYCDFSQLCTEFRKSYRKLDTEDTNETIKKQHIDAFYWMGRYIKSAIEFWGENIEKPGKRHAPFYLGLDIRCVFNQFSAVYQIPTSTTYSIEVAYVFAERNDSGIILELGPKFKQEIHASKCINVKEFSNFKGEKERLIAGTAILTIINIRDLKSRNNYKLVVKAILYFERITEQTFDRKAHYNYGQLSKKHQRLYLVPLLKYQMANYDEYPLDDYDAFLFYDPYICAIFNHFCDRQWKIDLSCINDEFVAMDSYLRYILFERINEREYKVNMSNIKYIFPNLKWWGQPVDNYINRDGLNILWTKPQKEWHPNFDGIQKPWPGDGRELYASDDSIQFQWKPEITNKRKCDTFHMLYLLQMALDKIRSGTNDRNDHFKQTKQTELYIAHLDGPLIISNILDWHNEDQETNKFNGDLVYESSEMQLIDVIAKICNISLDIAAKIVIKMKQICIAAEWIDRPQPMLQLKTRKPKGIEQCTVHEVITLLTFEGSGVFDLMEKQNVVKGRGSVLSAAEPDWKNKVCTFFLENNIDGSALLLRSQKHLAQAIMNAIVPVTELNEKSKPRNNILRGSVTRMIR